MRIAGRTLLAHVLDAVAEAGVTATAVVVGPGQDAVAAEAARVLCRARRASCSRSGGEPLTPCWRQKRRIEQQPDDILVVYGDTPLLRPQRCARLRSALATSAAVAVLAFRPANPTGYGRLITSGEELIAIREEADASAGERAIGLCNAGIMALAGK